MTNADFHPTDGRLAAIAPSLDLSRDHAATIRDAVLAHATTTETTVRYRPVNQRRWLAGGLAAATVAAALVVGPSLLPSRDPMKPNALTPLAQAAERTEVPVLSGHQVLHRITTYRDRGSSSDYMQWEEWTLASGQYYRRSTDTRTGNPPVVEFNKYISSDQFTPAEIADLPTEPTALLKAIRNSRQNRTKVGGDQTEDRLDWIIYQGYAPTKVWAAAIEALGSFSDITVRVDTNAKRTYVTQPNKGGTLTAVFDSATGALMGYDSTSKEDGEASHETMRVVTSQIVDGVPTSIKNAADATARRRGSAGG